MHPNEESLNAFYGAFASLDPDGMERCYADTVSFEDEVFTLNGRAEVMGMWRMLCDADGKIVQHRDRFDFWLWSRQALGAPGLLLGWTPFLRAKVRQQASAGLRKYLAAHR